MANGNTFRKEFVSGAGALKDILSGRTSRKEFAQTARNLPGELFKGTGRALLGPIKNVSGEIGRIGRAATNVASGGLGLVRSFGEGLLDIEGDSSRVISGPQTNSLTRPKTGVSASLVRETALRPEISEELLQFRRGEDGGSKSRRGIPGVPGSRGGIDKLLGALLTRQTRGAPARAASATAKRNRIEGRKQVKGISTLLKALTPGGIPIEGSEAIIAVLMQKLGESLNIGPSKTLEEKVNG